MWTRRFAEKRKWIHHRGAETQRRGERNGKRKRLNAKAAKDAKQKLNAEERGEEKRDSAQARGEEEHEAIGTSQVDGWFVRDRAWYPA